MNWATVGVCLSSRNEWCKIKESFLTVFTEFTAPAPLFSRKIKLSSAEINYAILGSKLLVLQPYSTAFAGVTNQHVNSGRKSAGPLSVRGILALKGQSIMTVHGRTVNADVLVVHAHKATLLQNSVKLYTPVVLPLNICAWVSPWRQHG